jgi:membrane peptidoglycan carboxypeptidase
VFPTVKRPVAGKSGTTDDNRSAWFIGFTPAIALGSFIADPDNPFHSIGTANHPKPSRTVAETLRDVLPYLPYRAFTPPPPQLVKPADKEPSKKRSH